MIPSVIQAISMPNHVVKAFFDDGKIVMYDVKPLIARGGVFAPLHNADFFKNVTVMNNTIAWDLSGEFDPTNCIDIDPCEVYGGN